MSKPLEVKTRYGIIKDDGFGGLNDIEINLNSSSALIKLNTGSDLIPHKMEVIYELLVLYTLTKDASNKDKVNNVIEFKRNVEPKLEFPCALERDFENFSISLEIVRKADFTLLIDYIRQSFDNCIMARILFNQYLLQAIEAAVPFEKYIVVVLDDMDFSKETSRDVSRIVKIMHKLTFKNNPFSNPFVYSNTSVKIQDKEVEAALKEIFNEK